MSAYLFRGLNVFQSSSQLDQHPYFAPSLTLTVPVWGDLSLGYWGAYQLTGPNVQEAIEAGLGAESDLWASYSHSIIGPLSAGVSFTVYVYPAANAEVAGTSVPVYLEPTIFASVVWLFDAGLKIAYLHGVQEALQDDRYIYINPSVGKTLEYSGRVALQLAASAGLKVFTDLDSPAAQANTVDVLVSAAIPIVVSGPLYIKPLLAWTWTNLADVGFLQGMAIAGGVNIGAEI